MRNLIFSGLFSVSLLIGLVSAQDAQVRKPNDMRETIVYPIRGVVAEQLAETLREFFGSRMHLAVEPNNNILLLSVPADLKDEVVRVLTELDPPARSMLVELQLLKNSGDESVEIDSAQLSGRIEEVQGRLGKLEADGKLFVVNQMQLTVVENQRTLLQLGKTVAVVTGSTSFGGGRGLSAYQDRQVGTLLSVQAVASREGGITVNLQFEQSEILPAEPDADGEQPVPASTSTMSHESTVQLKDGHSVLAGTLVGRSGDQSASAYLVIGARLQDQRGEAVTFRSLSRSGPAARSRTGGRVATPPRGRGFGPNRASAPRGGPNRASGSTSPRAGASGGFSRPSASSGSPSNRYQQYAASLVSKYDKDGDKKLNADERQQMSRQYPDADTDKDGFLTAEELATAIQRP